MTQTDCATPWRVLIVEDDSTTRAFFANSVRNCARLQLLADVASVHEASEFLHGVSASNAPDVLLTDLGLPDGSGLEVIRMTLSRFSQCEALVISMFGDEDNVLASIEAGAVGYIHKDCTPDDIAESILQLKSGASIISPMIARRVLSKYRSLMQIEPSNTVKMPVEYAQAAPKIIADSTVIADDMPAKPRLSGREQEVLELIARGFSYAEIARLHSVSVHTIQTHIKNLYAKLAVHNKSEAVYEATRLGLLA